MGTVAQPVRHNYARFTSDVLQRSQICGIGSDEGREKKRKEKRGERHDSIAALPTYEFVPIWLHFLAVSSPRSEELNKSLEVGRLPCSQRKKPFFFHHDDVSKQELQWVVHGSAHGQQTHRFASDGIIERLVVEFHGRSRGDEREEGCESSEHFQ